MRHPVWVGLSDIRGSNSVCAMGIFHTEIQGLGDREVITHLQGSLFSELPGQGLQPLLGCLGFTISKPLAGPGANGAPETRVVGREVMLWTDSVDGSVLDHWLNPLTGETVEVLHDWLDPMNLDPSVSAAVEVFGSETHYVWNLSAVAPCPLRVDVFTREVSAVVLEQTELVRLIQPGTSMSIVRTLPWLPWMLMGPTVGRLVMHLGGQVVDGGFAELPNNLRTYVEGHRPEFVFAPSRWETPNEDSWSLYGKERQPS
jgi:Protein of unknown function (DUF1838)